MQAASPNLIPDPVGWGSYTHGQEEICFYLGGYHEMELSLPSDPRLFAIKVAEIHNSTSPNGMFGFPVPTTIGILERTVDWDESWARSFTRQLQDVIAYDTGANGAWSALQAGLDRLIDIVIPRLLGILQSGGRSITPSLVHGDLWIHNVGHDVNTGQIVIFDPGCTYAHYEMEFGTWRCSWASHFKSPEYLQTYQRLIAPSEPAEEWDDRNRLYSIHPHLVDSAGHPGSKSRARYDTFSIRAIAWER